MYSFSNALVLFNYKKTGYYDYIFITDNPLLVSLLDEQALVHVYPNIFDEAVMQEYQQRVLERTDEINQKAMDF